MTARRIELQRWTLNIGHTTFLFSWFPTLNAFYRQLANISKEGVEPGVTNVCPMDNPCCVLSAFRLPPHVFVPRQGSQRSYTCLVRQAQPRQENLCLPHYRITHLTEDSVKVDALTGEVKSIIKWPGDLRLIVTAVFRWNTGYLKLIFFLFFFMSGSTFRFCSAFCGNAMVSQWGVVFLCVLHTGIIVVQCLRSVKFWSTFWDPSILKMGRLD